MGVSLYCAVLRVGVYGRRLNVSCKLMAPKVQIVTGTCWEVLGHHHHGLDHPRHALDYHRHVLDVLDHPHHVLDHHHHVLDDVDGQDRGC